MRSGILIIFLFAAVLFANSVFAIEGCCEQTTSGLFCQTVDESECSGRFAPTSCEQTSFCKLGCCFSSDEGRCFKQAPRATCSTEDGFTWEDSPFCAVDQCKKGCCILGDQASFVTEVKCKQTAQNYDVAFEFDPSVESETKCVEKVKNKDKGCCVTDTGCKFTTRDSCETASPEPGTNQTEAGFHKDVLCSNDELGCNCAKQTSTGCLGEDLYWFDSCGNPENIYDRDTVRSYNAGILLTEDQSCVASGPDDTDCGNCEYTSGSICGEDTEHAMPVGSSICRGVNCEETYDDEVSPNANGELKKNGESWCVFDSLPGKGRDLVGSRHYRILCANAEELVEPCKDYRQELCVQGVLGSEVLSNIEALQSSFQEGDYVEAACRDNRWENCFACNTVLEDAEEKAEKVEGLSETILQKRKECCANEFTGDCYWLPSSVTAADGTCVPQVPPGLNIQPSTSGAKEAASTDAQAVCSKGNSECKVIFREEGLSRLGKGFVALAKVFLVFSKEGPKPLINENCTQHEWVVAGNNICKSLGDCGAYYNIRGKISKSGYVNTQSGERNYFIGSELTDEEVGDYNSLLSSGLEDEEDIPKFWEFKKGDKLSNTNKAIFMSIAAFNVLQTGLPGNMLGGLTGLLGQLGGGSGGSGGMAGTLNSILGFGGLIPGIGGASGNKGQPGLLTKLFGTKEGWTGADLSGKGIETASSSALKPGEVLSKDSMDILGGKDKLVSAGVVDKNGKVLPKEIKPSGISSAITVYLWINTFLNVVNTLNKKDHEVTYSIQCNPWQPPTTRDDCETCNEEMKPCSEYKCMALGANCKLINKGTTNETCVASDANDVNSPLISPIPELLLPLTLEETTEEGNKGFRILEKVQPFRTVTLGLKLDEPAVCRYDIEPKKEYDNMAQTFGASLYLYEQKMTLTVPAELAQPAVTAVNKGAYNLYVRCSDANGNKNERDYFIKFTVDDSPDLTPPVVRYTSIANGGFVKNNVTELSLSLFIDEPAECKWSDKDIGFETMEHTMTCDTNVYSQSLFYGTYECDGALTGLKNGLNKFYFRCKDRVGFPEEQRNVNDESFALELQGTDALRIQSVKPSGKLFSDDATLEVATEEGASKGVAKCAFSLSDDAFEVMTPFFETDSSKHKQEFNGLPEGSYYYYIKCQDAAGNEVKAAADFSVEVDLTPPGILELFMDSLVGELHLELDEPAVCEYNDESFEFGEGTRFVGSNEGRTHVTSLGLETYQVACLDRFNNTGSYTIHTI
ncbi:hypothetical protein HY501_03665 [Candidatus Woesearchaeota archaeon]|nr:hypothetical protein [Candidatus Woesearchaeota archaeon]